MKEVKIKVALDSKDANKEVSKLKKGLQDIDNIDIESPFDEIYGEAKSLTQVMGGLQDRLYELAKAGDTNSKEFKALTAETGRLRKAQIKVDRAVDATARTLGEKLANGANMAASAYSIVQGAMGAMNMENEEMEKSMQRVISAMAVAQGISGFTVAMQGSALATKGAAAAQTLYNLALKANPIGLVVTAIASLVGGFTLLTNWMDKNSEETKRNKEAQEALEREIKDTNDAIDKQVWWTNQNRKKSKEYTDQAIEEAKARGATAKEIRKMQMASMDNAIAKTTESINILANARAVSLETTELKRNRVEKLKGMIQDATLLDRFEGKRLKWMSELTDLEKELVAPTEKEDTLSYQIGQENIVLGNLLQERTDMINDHKVQTITEDTQAQKDARPQDLKPLGEDLESEGFSDSEDGEGLLDVFTPDEDVLASGLQVFDDYILKVNDIYQRGVKNKEDAANAQMDLDMQIAQSLQYGFDVAAGLAKEGSKLQKAILIAKQAAAAVELGLSIKSTITAAKETATKATLKASEAAVDSSTGAIKTAASAPFPANLPLIIGYAGAAAGIMSGVMSAVNSSKNEASRLGGGSGGSTPRPQPVQAPAFNLVEGTESNSIQSSIENQGSQPIKAYVVSGEVQSQASLDRQIQDSASI